MLLFLSGRDQVGTYFPSKEYHEYERAANAANHEVNAESAFLLVLSCIETCFASPPFRTIVECGDAQRNLVAALNGLAGVALIKGGKAQAVRNYRQVLSMEFKPIDDESRNQLPTGINEGSTIA